MLGRNARKRARVRHRGATNQARCCMSRRKAPTPQRQPHVRRHGGGQTADPRETSGDRGRMAPPTAQTLLQWPRGPRERWGCGATCPPSWRRRRPTCVRSRRSARLRNSMSSIATVRAMRKCGRIVSCASHLRTEAEPLSPDRTVLILFHGACGPSTQPHRRCRKDKLKEGAGRCVFDDGHGHPPGTLSGTLPDTHLAVKQS